MDPIQSGETAKVLHNFLGVAIYVGREESAHCVAFESFSYEDVLRDTNEPSLSRPGINRFAGRSFLNESWRHAAGVRQLTSVESVRLYGYFYGTLEQTLKRNVRSTRPACRSALVSVILPVVAEDTVAVSIALQGADRSC